MPEITAKSPALKSTASKIESSDGGLCDSMPECIWGKVERVDSGGICRARPKPAFGVISKTMCSATDKIRGLDSLIHLIHMKPHLRQIILFDHSSNCSRWTDIFFC